MPEPAKRKKHVWTLFCTLNLLLITACVLPPKKPQKISREHIYDDFILVKTNAEDTFSSLSAKYLNDPNKGWWIAEFNDIQNLTSGQELIIPLSLLNKGGLNVEGYQTVPVLAYHRFTKDRSNKMSVAQEDFEAQMMYLKENGYHVVSLDQLLDFIDYKASLPKKSVVITFDDAWRSIYDIAFPILKKFDFPATFFIYTDFIGGGKAMSWKQIKTLSENGYNIECQTKTHRNLASLKKNESFNEYLKSLEEEIRYPKDLIKKKLNKDCKYLAYPYGKTNDIVISMLKKYGYRSAFTVDRGSNPFFIDKYRIHRSVIYGKFDLEQFKKNLSSFLKTDLK